jgi:D-sedoheptulose 7-phosphate isomerase
MEKAKQYLIETAKESAAIRERFLEEHSDDLLKASQWLGESISRGGKVLFIGNGGSAADAQHAAAEMVGRMLLERRPLPAIALTTDTSNLTAIGNDYGYDQVFVRQVQALARPGDVLVAISTSGNSKNVVLAVEAAKAQGAKIISLTGGTGGKLKEMSDLTLNASLGKNSSRIQETHIFALHGLVDLLDRFYLPEVTLV